MKIKDTNDKVLLEGLTEKYGPEALTALIAAMERQQPVEIAEKTISPEEAILDYIMGLEGWRIRLREIHWSTESNAIHDLTDRLINDFEYNEDKIAECLMGLCGIRIKVGQICPNIPVEADDLESLLNVARTATVTLIASLESDKNYDGVVNILDEILETINKAQYKETLE